MITAKNIYVPPWGLHVTFKPGFNTPPTVNPAALTAGRSAVPILVTASGCTLLVLDKASGRSVGGLVNYTAG